MTTFLQQPLYPQASEMFTLFDLIDNMEIPIIPTILIVILLVLLSPIWIPIIIFFWVCNLINKPKTTAE